MVSSGIEILVGDLMSRASKDLVERSPRYVFIFTYGRSGSTLLLGYLNSLPGYCVRGENYMALGHLCQFYRSVKNTTGQIAKKTHLPTHPWFGAEKIDLDKVRSGIRDLFVDTVLNPGSATTVGCKEIRIRRNEIEDFDGFISDVFEIFGDVKIIFNHRNVADTAKSKWWKGMAHSYPLIKSMDDRMRLSAFANSPGVFHLEYEKFVSDPKHAEELTHFLGAPFDAGVYREVLATRHSY